MRPQPKTTFDLASLQLSHGEGRSVELPVRTGELELGGQTYRARPDPADARLDVSRTRTGHAMRLRFDLSLEGPCMRCLEAAGLEMAIDAREVDQPGSGDEEMLSPYVSDGSLDAGRWLQDAIVLEMPTQPL
ncbi:MAG: YceD family protein, partial [Solirubrobacterales bacterium]